MLLSEHADSLELAATLETHVPGLGQAGRGDPPPVRTRHGGQAAAGTPGAGTHGCCARCVPAAPASDGGCGRAAGSCSPTSSSNGGPPATITPSLPAPSHPQGTPEPRVLGRGWGSCGDLAGGLQPPDGVGAARCSPHPRWWGWSPLPGLVVMFLGSWGCCWPPWGWERSNHPSRCGAGAVLGVIPGVAGPCQAPAAPRAPLGAGSSTQLGHHPAWGGPGVGGWAPGPPAPTRLPRRRHLGCALLVPSLCIPLPERPAPARNPEPPSWNCSTPKTASSTPIPGEAAGPGPCLLPFPGAEALRTAPRGRSAAPSPGAGAD